MTWIKKLPFLHIQIEINIFVSGTWRTFLALLAIVFDLSWHVGGQGLHINIASTPMISSANLTITIISSPLLASWPTFFSCRLCLSRIPILLKKWALFLPIIWCNVNALHKRRMVTEQLDYCQGVTSVDIIFTYMDIYLLAQYKRPGMTRLVGTFLNTRLDSGGGMRFDKLWFPLLPVEKKTLNQAIVVFSFFSNSVFPPIITKILK